MHYLPVNHLGKGVKNAAEGLAGHSFAINAFAGKTLSYKKFRRRPFDESPP
jgi:hypothetical protein